VAHLKQQLIKLNKKNTFLTCPFNLETPTKANCPLQINADNKFVLFNDGRVTTDGKHNHFVIPKGAWTLSD
jgi:hypothetical protein